MFSTTTMLSSTRRPRARTKPAIDSWLRVKPKAWTRARPISRDSGIDIITTTPARRPSGRRVMRTRPTAMPKSRNSFPRRWSTFSDWKKARSSFTPAGRVFSCASSARRTWAVICPTSSPSFWVTVTKTARLPLNRARWPGSSWAQATSATSRTRTTRPSRLRTGVSATDSRVSKAPPVLTLNRRSPAWRAPTGASAPRALRASVTAVAGSWSAASLARSRETRTSEVGAPQ